MALTSLPFQQYETVVGAQWIDVNDHMNARFYSDVIYEAHALLTTYIGLGDDYVVATACGKVVAESHLIYERELRKDARIGVRSWLLAVDEKRLHFAHELLNLDEGYRAAFAEQLDLHIDLTARRVAPLPEALRNRLQTLSEGADAARANLPVGRAVRMPSRSSAA